MSENQNLQCSFCGKTRNEVDKLIAGPSVYICNECVVLSYNIVIEEQNIEKTPLDIDNIPTPREIKKHLDNHIIGHDSTKELLSVSSYNHYKRLLNNSKIDKSNVLLVGPTGTGKTLFAKTLAKLLDVPFAIADATTLTEAGYVGEDVESVLERLLSIADYNVELAQTGIVYIDEVDKKARRGESNTSTRDVSGEGVQQALLRLIEGSSIKVKTSLSSNKRSTPEDYIEFDTTNVLFILGGAFVGLDDIVKKRLNKKSSIGFGSKLKTENMSSDFVLQQTNSKDITDFGLIPELVGRMPVIAVLDNLGAKQLRLILDGVENSIVEQYQELLFFDDIDLVLEDQFLDEVAEQAHKQKLGARGLKGILENALISVMYRAPEFKKQGVNKVVFHKYPLAVETKPELHKEDGTVKEDLKYKLYRGLNEK